ncbi:MAG: MFS transporter [Imperialibacter sp.]|uniref:MFS transporter n=1 Tax=Imperialibacter sp. TaxID=2038411 RepID=UPI0032EB76A3
MPADSSHSLKSSVIKNYRWYVCALLFYATTLRYVDRQVIGILKPTLEQYFGWSEIDYSHVVMAFTASYALGLLSFGGLIDRIGTKLGYSLSLIIWSLASMAHAITTRTIGFASVRAVLGLSEAMNLPTAIKTVAEWFPKKERALATGIFISGTNVGAIVAPILVPIIVSLWGWEEAFILTGAMGFVWLALWWRFYDIPVSQKRLSKEEYDYIHSDDEEKDESTTRVSWLKLLSFRQTWAFIVGKFLSDPIWWFFLFWLPSYFVNAFQVDFTKPSLLLAIIYTATTLGSIVGGYLSSWLIKKGWPIFKARRVSMLVFALCVVPIMLAQFLDNLWIAVALVSLAAASHQGWSANILTTIGDEFPKKVISSLIGIGTLAGALGGVLFPIVVGRLLDYYKALGDINAGYSVLFIICGCAYVVALMLMHLISPRPATIKI